MLAGSSSAITGAASTVVRDNLNRKVVLISINKESIAASNVPVSQLQSVITGGATTIID